MNDLEKYFFNNKGAIIHKWVHYFDIYDRHFSRFRHRPLVVLEIGVSHGGSLQMWKNYFGLEAKIFGIDINPECKQAEDDQINIFIGSQSDRSFLKMVTNAISPIDILIDDGSHKMNQQIASFEGLFDHISEGGVYLCEDLHTSYWEEYGGGYLRSGTFVEYCKSLIDKLNAHHSRDGDLKISDFTQSVDSIHFYDSVVVIEKKARTKPYHMKTGRIKL